MVSDRHLHYDRSLSGRFVGKFAHRHRNPLEDAFCKKRILIVVLHIKHLVLD